MFLAGGDLFIGITVEYTLSTIAYTHGSRFPIRQDEVYRAMSQSLGGSPYGFFEDLKLYTCENAASVI